MRVLGIGVPTEISRMALVSIAMETHFTDRELRALLLTHFYDHRKESFAKIENASALIPDGSESESHRIVKPLADFGLVEGDPILVPKSHGYETQYR